MKKAKGGTQLQDSSHTTELLQEKHELQDHTYAKQPGKKESEMEDLKLVSEELVSEELVTEELIKEKLITKELVPEKLVTEELITEEPITEELITEELITEELITEELVTEELVTEELVTEVGKEKVIDPEILKEELARGKVTRYEKESEDAIDDIMDSVISDGKCAETRNPKTKQVAKPEKKLLLNVYEAEVAEVVNTSFLVIKRRGKVSKEIGRSFKVDSYHALHPLSIKFCIR